jgi:hypothetical protein
MEKRGFCTIVTVDYLPYAYSVYESLTKQGISFDFHILISDRDRKSTPAIKNDANIFYYFYEDFQQNELACKIYQKYYKDNMDCFRWSFKPLLINHLLHKGRQKVIYVDSDLFFYKSCEFIFEALDEHYIILAPHWRCSDPDKDDENFYKNFTEGIYNGGFIAVSTGGEAAMEWWAKACEYQCVKQPVKGFYDDQKYLDFLSSKFPKVGVLSHQGCNLGEWNRVECRRTIDEHGHVLINQRWEVIFIHFTGMTIQRIVLGEDPLLLGHLKEYTATLKKFDSEALDVEEITQKLKSQYTPATQSRGQFLSRVFTRIRERVRLGTRISKFIEG